MYKFLGNILTTFLCIKKGFYFVYQSNKRYFYYGMLIQIFSALSTYVILLCTKNIVNILSYILSNDGYYSSSNSEILFWLSVSTLIIILQMILTYLNEIIFTRQQIDFGVYIDKALANKVLDFDIACYDDSKVYDLIESAMRGKPRINNLFYRVTFLLSNTISFATAFILAFNVIDSKYLIIILILSVPGALSKIQYHTLQSQYENDNRTLLRKISYIASIAYNKDTIKENRFYNFSDFIANKHFKYWNKYLSGVKKIILKNGMFDSILGLLPYIGITLSQISVIENIITGKSEVGDFIYVLGILMSFSMCFGKIVEDLSKIKEIEIALHNFDKLMDLDFLRIINGSMDLVEILTIEFKNVVFVYPETSRKVLNNVSFTIKRPESCAIVGINGSGKSTIIKLLLRLYDVSSGEILINGLNIKEYKIESLRKRISPIFQDYFIFESSLEDNISYSSLHEKIDRYSIFASIAFANLQNVFTENDLNKNIGKSFSEDGVELSGGQKQKLAIARGVYRKSDFIVIDESDSALDAEAEYKIINNLCGLKNEDKGIIIITHRLSNVMTMNQIVLIENGEIIGKGNHKQLLLENQRYFQLFNLQAQKYKVDMP